jgi:CHAT domain-containing protein
LQVPEFCRRPLRGVIAAFLAVVFALASGLAFSITPGKASSRSYVVRLGSDTRAIQGRLSGVPYAPFSRDRNGTSVDLRRNARAVRKASEEGSPQALVDLALLEIFARRPGHSLSLLRLARKKDGADASLLSDIAAVHLGISEREDPLRGLRALAATEEALHLDGTRIEARFNRALALEDLGFAAAARKAWRDYLAADARSAWSTEARARLGGLERDRQAARWKRSAKARLERAGFRQDDEQLRALVSADRQSARELVEEKLLGEWGRASLRQPSRGDELLALAETTGAALAAAGGDSMAKDAVGVVRRAEGSPRWVLRLAEGHALYQEALESYRAGAFEESQRLFTRAARSLESAESPFAARAEFYSAVSMMQTFRYTEAKHGLQILGRSRYPALRGRAAWIRGLLEGIGGRPAEALREYRAARRAFQIAGERANVAAISSLTAEALRNFGDPTSAWRLHLAALRNLNAIEDPLRREAVLQAASATLLVLSQPRAALYLEEESEEAAGELGPLARAESLRRRAAVHRALGDSQGALRLLDLASEALEEAPGEAAREGVLGTLLLARGEIVGTNRHHGAVSLLSEAIRVYQETSYEQELPLLYLVRGRLALQAGEERAAGEDLAHAAELIDGQRRSMDWLDEMRFVEWNRQIYDEMVELATRQGRVEQAFDFAERARAAQPLGPQKRVLGLAEIQRRLPQDVALLAFTVREHRLITWLVRSSSLDCKVTELRAGALPRIVERMREEVLHSGRSGRATARLYDLLVRPMQGGLFRGDTIVIVPDDPLVDLPFAALRDARSGRFLVEDHAIVMAPSATAYLRGRELDARRQAPALSVLAFGEPRFDPELLPDLPPLPFARVEADAVAALYISSTVLRGRDIDKRSFAAHLGRHPIVHFAGHALAGTGTAPPALVLAPRADHSGLLYAREVSDIPIERTRLLVLSACRTFAANDRQRTALASISWPFLNAGVPAVIGTLWKLEDRRGLEVSLALHRQLARGLGPAAALQEAQKSLIGARRDGESLRSWAAFQLWGGTMEEERGQ